MYRFETFSRTQIGGHKDPTNTVRQDESRPMCFTRHASRVIVGGFTASQFSRCKVADNTSPVLSAAIITSANCVSIHLGPRKRRWWQWRGSMINVIILLPDRGTHTRAHTYARQITVSRAHASCARDYIYLRELRITSSESQPVVSLAVPSTSEHGSLRSLFT